MKPLSALLMALLVACAPAAQSTTTSLGTDESSTTVAASSTTASTSPTTTTAPTTTTQATTTSTFDPTALNIMFVGNSHTSTHNVPAIVEALLDSTGSDASVALFGASFLRTASGNQEIVDAIENGSWDIVVLQGQEISQSHTVSYSQDEAISLARLAIDAGSRPLFFSEWKRRGNEERAYIEGIYEEMAEASGAEVIPIGRAWDVFLETNPGHELWATDGNHSSPDGAFLAAATIAYFIAGPDAQLIADPDKTPFLDAARTTIATFLGG